MIIWIASYPKSGNTWIRAFLSAYLYLDLESNKNSFNFGLLDKIRSFPSIDYYLTEKTNLKNFDDVAMRWIPIQEKINLNGKINFLKTHSAIIKYKDFKFTDKKNTLGAIYIVRDPRDVLISNSQYMNKSYKKTLETLSDETAYGKFISYGKFGKTNIIHNLPAEVRGSWSKHYISWKSFYLDESLGKILIIKYEDLIKEPYHNFLKIIIFLNKLYGLKINKEKIHKCIEVTSFKKLQKLEKKFGFEEKLFKKEKKPFFNKGEQDQWKEKLDNKIIYRIEKNFKKEMKELNYI